MKKISPLLLLSFLLMTPSGTTSGAENNDCKILKDIFHTEVSQENGVCKVEITRRQPSVFNFGVKLPPQLIELSFDANFVKAGDQAVVVGEFALLGEEVNPVIDSLRKGNVDITAVHNHLFGEQPRILYLHFQGKGDLASLAKTVKSAIGTTNQ